MRLRIGAGILGLALALAVTPAEAAWQAYFNKQGLGFSFTAPGELKGQKSTYRSAVGGQRDAIVFTSVEDNLEFKIILVDFSGRASDDSALIREASTALVDKTKVLTDNEARVESSYGRKFTVDLPNNGGRLMSGIFFKDNHLLQLQAKVLPGGDILSSDMGRFVDSLAFNETRADEGATELKMAN